MATRNELTRTIATIGGVVSRTFTASHPVRQRTPTRVVLIDQQPYFGLGLAYSTPSRHPLNVRAGKISSLLNQPEHFMNWLRKNYDPTAVEKSFASRDVSFQGFGACLVVGNGMTDVIVTAIRGCDHQAELTWLESEAKKDRA